MSTGNRCELVSLSIEQGRLKLDFLGVETQSGLLRWYVETNDNGLVIEGLTVHYKRKRPPFWQRHWWKPGIAAGIIT